MKTIALALTLSLAAASAHAQTRPSTTAMSCGGAAALVASRGAIVLGTGRDTFDRFVRDRSFCAAGQFTLTTFAPTADNPQCFVGYRCYDPPVETR